MRGRAAGKLMLTGEYAVLLGAPALVTTVDRHVVANTEGQGGYTLIGAEASDALARCALEAAGRLDLLERLVVDVSELYTESGEKLGLGSSAASIVAICRAAGVAEDRLLNIALDAHHALQGGAGSGADIAACVAGRSIAYTIGNANWGDWPALCELGGEPKVEEVNIPNDLRIEAVWLGKPASSTALMNAVQSVGFDEVRPFLEAVKDASTAAITAAKADDADGFLSAIEAGADGMERLGQASGAPIVVDAHHKLAEAASSLGIIAKPSGAGGGDFSICVGRYDADWDGLLRLNSRLILPVC